MPWPRSLFGRLIAAAVIGVLLAQAATLYLVARDGQRIFVQATTRMWARRITAITLLLDRLPAPRRAAALEQLKGGQRGLGPFSPSGPGGAAVAARARALWLSGPTLRMYRSPHARARWRARLHFRALRQREAPVALRVRLPFRTDERPMLLQRLREDLGPGYRVELTPAADAADAIVIPAPLFQSSSRPNRYFDVAVRSAARAPLVFRVAQLAPEVPLPRALILNLILLVVVLVAALYVATRGITRPLSSLSRAAEAMGRGTPVPALREEGARELRHAARAFNTMQDRLRRYLDSRTQVLAAMSHDLKTPITRLRLQVETLIEDEALRARMTRELEEMQSMVHGALALFRGLNEREPGELIDVCALIESVREGFTAMGEQVTVSAGAVAPFFARPQALKRCLTNLVANAVKFARRAEISVQDGEVLRIRVRDRGPGIPQQELQRVFEPFYRLESSRNRDTGGTGLGLSIARDIAQAHGGTLVLRNRPEGGLEAELCLPRGGIEFS